MYKIMTLLHNFSSETTWPVFTKFHVKPIVETGFKVCSNDHAPLTVTWQKIIIIITCLFLNQELLKKMILSILQ